MSVSSESAGSLSLFCIISNTGGNGRTGDNILLRCPTETLFETFFAKMNVRQRTNKSVGIHVKYQFNVVPCKKKWQCAKLS